MNGSSKKKSSRGVGPVTVRGEARKLVLIRAAREEFESNGFFHTRIGDIVRRAGVAQGTFYTYFHSKEAVFEAIAKSVATDMLMSLGAGQRSNGTPYERARSAMERFVESYRSNARWFALINEVTNASPEVRHLRLQIRQSFIDRLARGIRHQQRSGHADPDVDADLMAEVLGSMVDHICDVWFNMGREFEEDRLIDHITLVYARALGLPGQPSGPPSTGPDHRTG
ncbi:TetR/AcrR family transcriptional regulator [Cumulibacter soli]|uniref:TetR/AcrR family transcriptional regulator n=1 Tax=Cumulibacter soli TaxID=2546344 RepID=UPI00141996BB|nr:TetR/AcrR family transcriptional regulator [Cumulibacter soli]